MNHCDATIHAFLLTLSNVHGAFLGCSVRLHDLRVFKHVTRVTAPSTNSKSDEVTLAFFLNCELVQPLDTERQTIGAHVLLIHDGRAWRAEAEIGWSGRLGWDNFYDNVLNAPVFAELEPKLGSLVDDLLARFESEVKKLQLPKVWENPAPG